jgi:hypothetical protein
VDPIPEPVLLRKSGRAGYAARNSDHKTTEADSGEEFSFSLVYQCVDYVQSNGSTAKEFKKIRLVRRVNLLLV